MEGRELREERWMDGFADPSITESAQCGGGFGRRMHTTVMKSEEEGGEEDEAGMQYENCVFRNAQVIVMSLSVCG